MRGGGFGEFRVSRSLEMAIEVLEMIIEVSYTSSIDQYIFDLNYLCFRIGIFCWNNEQSKTFQEIKSIPRNRKHSKKSKTFQEIKNIPRNQKLSAKKSNASQAFKINQSIHSNRDLFYLELSFEIGDR
jgi:hypothetical protein